MDYVKIGGYLQALRKNKGLTQAELAEKFNVSNKTVSKWECGETLPEIPLLMALAEYYGLTVDDILKGKKESVETENTNSNVEIQEYYCAKYKRKMVINILISLIISVVALFTSLAISYGTNNGLLPPIIGIAIVLVSIAVFFILYVCNEKNDCKLIDVKYKRFSICKITIPTIYILGMLLIFLIHSTKNLVIPVIGYMQFIYSFTSLFLLVVGIIYVVYLITKKEKYSKNYLAFLLILLFIHLISRFIDAGYYLSFHIDEDYSTYGKMFSDNSWALFVVPMIIIKAVGVYHICNKKNIILPMFLTISILLIVPIISYFSFDNYACYYNIGHLIIFLMIIVGYIVSLTIMLINRKKDLKKALD